MAKKRHNTKGRQIFKTNIDNSETEKIKLEFGSSEYGGNDASNLIAIPSKKRNTKIIKEKKGKIKILSKLERKRLEKIVQQKEKKLNRAVLLDKLSKVQASSEEMALMTSITTAQTLGVKRIDQLSTLQPTEEVGSGLSSHKIRTVAGAKKRMRLLNLLKNNVKKTKYDPNIVGLEESSSDESSNESDGVLEVDSQCNDKHIESDKTFVESKSVACNGEDKETDVEANTSNIQQQELENTQIGEEKKQIAISVDEDVSNIQNIDEKKVPLKIPLKAPNTLVQVDRDPKIQVARLKLPILGDEQKVMEVINENEIVIISGKTGCGKTTQVPQFLYEAGYATEKMIGVTEPRRVATVAMAARVGQELGLPSDVVSYLMRFEGNVTEKTKIKFMTDGVLLKEVQSDILLSKYSVIIIDEAHERSVFTDILLGLLSRIVPLRRKKCDVLRLIVMSATLRIEDFIENKTLFKQRPPVLEIEARQFLVTVHFNKKTPPNYMKEAYKKVCKIHNRLPEGGILVFVTGQQEVHWLVRKLKKSFPYKDGVDYSKFKFKTNQDVDPELDSDPEDLDSDDDAVEREMKRAKKARKKSKMKKLPKINLDDFSMPQDDGMADLIESEDEENLESDSDDDTPTMINETRPMWPLPLYSMLNREEQMKIFNQPPAGARLCVVSTDVAETSLTIPGIKFVVDTGKKKDKLYDMVTGVSTYRVSWTSQAGAEQRTGRAGRTAPGHCYRLYSSAVYQHDFQKYPPPDLLRRPIDDLVLQMKSMGIDKVINFPFPTPLDRLQLRLAEKRLKILGILEPAKTNTEKVLKVTSLGSAVAAFPVMPRFGKMLALSHQHNLLPHTIRLVAAMSVPELMVNPTSTTSWTASGHMQLLGDPGVLLRATGGAIHAALRSDLSPFCTAQGISHKGIADVLRLVKQLTNEIRLSVQGVELDPTAELKPPDEKQARLLRQLMLSALGDQVARKIGLHEIEEGKDKRKYKYAYNCGELEEPVHLHSSSLLRKTIPDWLVYSEIYETGHEEGSKKIIIKNACAIEPEWLPIYVPHLCNMGQPLPEPEPNFDPKSGRVKCYLKGSFGKAGWELPLVQISYPDSVEKYKWFARFLLEGKVYPKLAKYTKALLSPPSTMIKSWAKLQPRTEVLLKALLNKNVGSRDELNSVWKDQPKYLLGSYLQWLPESAHNEVALFWPPL